MSEHPRPRDLEAFAAGEPAAATAAHVAACPRCRDELAALDDDRRRLLARAPAAEMIAAVSARRRDEARRDRRRARWLGSGAGVAALAAAAVVTWIVVARGTPAGARLKGTGVEIYRQRDGAVTTLGPADRVRAGDGLRISITLAAPDRVSVWFVDGTGRVDRYPGADRLALDAGAHVLPDAVVVDAPCVDMTLVVATRDGESSRKLRCE